jgi:transposase
LPRWTASRTGPSVCRIPAFVELGRKIRKNIAGIEAAILKDSSNAVIESTNTKIRVLHRMALDFANPST